jgi:hypothetical protein
MAATEKPTLYGTDMIFGVADELLSKLNLSYFVNHQLTSTHIKMNRVRLQILFFYPIVGTMSALTAYIENVLTDDRACRQPGGLPDDSKLNHLDDLHFDNSYNYGLPTLVNKNDYDRAKVAHRTSSSFKEAFYNDFPLLKSVNLSNILISGGSIGHYLTNKTKHHGDIDCFFYGLSKEEANSRIREFIHDLFVAQEEKELEEERAKQVNRPQGQKVQANPSIANNKPKKVVKILTTYQDEDEDSQSIEEDLQECVEIKDKDVKDFKCKAEVKMVRSRSGLSIEIAGQIYQIIFRLYKSKSEILHGFDLGPSAVGFDGNTVYLTNLGKLSYEYRIMVLDTTRRSTTYEHRIQKYFHRGFELVLPNMDVAKLSTRYHKYHLAEVCDLPYLPFSYTDIIGNKIFLKEFLQVPRMDTLGKDDIDNEKPSDYDLNSYDEYKLLYINLYSLLHGGIDRMYYYSNHPSYDILAKPPCLSVKSVQYFYERARNDLVKHDTFNHKLVTKYLTVSNLKDVLANTLLSSESIDTQNAYLDELFKKQTDFVIKEIELIRAKDHSKIPWLTENPGTQLTSSFNPILEKAQEWYVQYYKEGNK